MGNRGAASTILCHRSRLIFEVIESLAVIVIFSGKDETFAVKDVPPMSILRPTLGIPEDLSSRRLAVKHCPQHDTGYRHESSERISNKLTAPPSASHRAHAEPFD